MADEFTAEGTLANVLSGVQNRSRLTSPDRKAYDPSTAEISILNQLSGPGASQLVGFLGGARADRQAASDQYDTSLAAVNNRAAILAQQDDATKRRGQNVNLAVAGAQNPNASAAFNLIYEQIRPEARGLMNQLAVSNGQYRQAQVEETLAQAAERRANAADGGSGGAAAARNDPLSIANLTRVQTQVRAAENAADRATAQELTRIYGRPVNQVEIARGTFIPAGGQAPLTAEQQAAASALIARNRAAARDGVLAIYPDATRQRFGTQPQPAQQGATPAAPAPAQAQAPVVQPAAPAAAAPTVVTPEARTRAQAQATAAGGTLQVNPATGAMRIKLPNGTFQPIGQ